MRIVVPIKQVPETTSVRMDETTGTMVREGVAAIVNPLDLYAIEAALAIAAGRGGSTLALSMGPPRAVKAVREAVAMGIDEGVLLSHRAFAGSDTWATARALAAAVRKIAKFDLIICGERATDGDTGQVGPELAAFLDLPVVTYVSEIVDVGDGCLVVKRLVEGGYETLQIELPALITVVKEIARPRLPTLSGKRKARDTQIPVWGPDDIDVERKDLGLDGSPTRVVKIFRPKVARVARMITAADEAGIECAAVAVLALVDAKGALS